MSAPTEGSMAGSNELELGEHRPEAGPAVDVERIVRRAAGDTKSLPTLAPEARLAWPKYWSAVEQQRERGVAGGARRVEQRAELEREAGARLEREVVHRLLRVLVRLDRQREAERIGRRRARRRIGVDVGRAC